MIFIASLLTLWSVGVALFMHSPYDQQLLQGLVLCGNITSGLTPGTHTSAAGR